MLRRQVLSHDRDNHHQHTPRKQRTYQAYTLATRDQDTVLYGNKMTTSIVPFEQLEYKLQEWIGKEIVIDGESPLMGNKYVYENEIARYARPNVYRILYTASSDITKAMQMLRSKPSVEYTPSRLNVIVDDRNKVIGFGYF